MQKHSPSSCCSGVMALPGWEGARAAGPRQGRIHQASNVSEEVVGRGLFESASQGACGQGRGKVEACNHGWGQVKTVAGGVGGDPARPWGLVVDTKEEGGV